MDPTLAQLLTGGFDQRFNDAYADPSIALQLQNQALGFAGAPAAPVAPEPVSPGYPWNPTTTAASPVVGSASAADIGGGAGYYGGSPTTNPNLAPTTSVGGSSNILNSLRGVTAPAAPTAQKVSTPHAPQVRPIQGGELVNMLAAMGMGPRDIWTPPRIRTGGG